MLEIGSLVDGKYRILRVVGKGGMSVVYQAVNEKANKIWAIKEVRKDGVQNYEVVKQNLIVETDLLKRFNHPNLPSIIDVIDGDGSFLIVMDYIEGNSLSKALETGGAQNQADVIEWSKQLCDVLGYLHSRKPPIIYRDMKPANVMLKPDGNVSLIDFGTAREFKSSSVEDTTCLGTQGYAAPEQYGGHGQTDARTDIYCLGATMYHLVTGHNPSTPPYEMYPIRQWNPLLSSGLEEIILKCTQRNPDDRYQSCAELLYALDHYQDLDIENKKTQKIKWRTFIASLIMTVVMLFVSIGFSIAASSMTTQTYSSLMDESRVMVEQINMTNQNIENAKYKDNNDPDKNKQEEEIKELSENVENNYIEAITKIEPDNIEAYKCLLNFYLIDDKLDDKEYPKLQKYIRENKEGLKATDEAKYINEFVVPFADALFFSYGSKTQTDTNGISFSAKWYEEAKNSPFLNPESQKKVEALLVISSNYNNVGKTLANGDTIVSVEEYFTILNNLVDFANGNEINIKIKLKLYNFVSAEISGKYKDFKLKQCNYLGTLDTIKNKTDEIKELNEYKVNFNELSDFMDSIESFIKQVENTLEDPNRSNNTEVLEGAGD